MRGLIFFVLLIMSASSMSQEIDPCGHVDGNVTPYDTTICKNDRAFNVLYSLFPNVYREVSKISSLDELNDEALQEKMLHSGYSRADSVFELLYALFFDIAKWLMVIYSVFYLFDLGSRYIKDGDLTQGGRYKSHKMVGGVMSSVFLLVPYKNFFMGQIIVFSLSILSLGMVNFIHSTFVSAQQERLEVQWEETLTANADGRTEINPENLEHSTLKEDRHNHLSRKFYEHLVMVELCRKQSADYLLKEVSGQVSPSEVEGFRSCFYGSKEKVSMANKTTAWLQEHSELTSPSFITLRPQSGKGIYDDSRSIVSQGFIDFELAQNESPSCSVDDHENKYYKCGSLEFFDANWEQSPFTTIVGGDFLQDVLMDVNSAISLDSSPSDIATLARSGWSRIMQKIDSEIGDWDESALNRPLNLNVMSVENFNKHMREKREIEDKKSVLYAKNSNAMRQFASFYYRTVMNSLMFGRVSSLHSDSGTINSVDGRSEISTLVSHMETIRPLAKIVEEANCTLSPFNLQDSISGVSYITGADDTSPESKISFRCVNWEDKTVAGYHPELEEATEDDRREFLVKRYDELVLEYETKMKAAYSKLSNARKAVEAAFIEDSNLIRGENIWVTMRQEGFLSMANYAFVMNEEYQTVREQIRYITNNFTAVSLNADRQMLSASLYYSDRDEGLAYPYFDEGRLAISYLDDQFKSVDPLVSRTGFIQSKMALHFDRTFDEDNLKTILHSLGDIWSFPSDFESFGMSELKLYQPGVKEACMNDVSKCPFPTKDPFIQLNQFGHSIVNAGNAYIAAVAGGKIVAMMLQKTGIVSKFFRKEGGSTSSGWMAKQFDSIKSKAYGVASALVVGEILAEFGGKIVDATLVLVMMMWILGAGLAYLMPLIPFLFVYFGFIAWVLIVFMTSFSVFIFSVYLIRYNEKQKDIVRSAVHYAGQILFRLPLQYISLLFAWYFFYAVSYFIANTVGLVNMGLADGSGGLFGFIHEIFSWVTVAFVFFFGLKMSFNVVEDLTGELIRKLGMEHKDAKDKVNDVIKAVLFDQAQEAANNMGEKGKSAQKSPERSAYNKALKKMQGMKGG